MAERVRRWLGVAGAVAMVFAAGCGDAGGETAVSITAESATSATIATVTVAASSPPASTSPAVAGAAASVLEGVVVTIGQTMAEPYPWWWVIDLADGAVIEGSSRVLVEVANDDVGCGDEFHPMFAHQIEAGEAVSFEVVAGEPGPRPEFWMIDGGETFDAAPAVRGQRLRAACPEGTDAVAEELAAQRAVWDERGPSSYEFSMTWHIFNNSFGDYRIGVAAGAAVSVVKDGATRLNPVGVEGDLPLTIDELFDELERQVSGDSFVATYDPQLGFPVSVDVDQMLEAVDDELEVRVADLVAGVPAAVVDQPPSIGQRVEATAIEWPLESPDGVSFWLVVDAGGGVTIDGSSRLSVQVPVGEVRCGAELRPIDTLESLQGPATVTFEVTSLDADAPPDASPMRQPDWPSVSGRQLHIPTCPPTSEDLLAELYAARGRWVSAGIEDYEMDLHWGPLGAEWTRHRITVVDREVTSVVTLDENDEPIAPEQDPAVLAVLPGTVEEIFDWLAVALPAQQLTVSYDEADGHPRGAYGGTTEIDVNLRPTGS